LDCKQGDPVGRRFNLSWRNGHLSVGGIKAVEQSTVMMPMLAQFGPIFRDATNKVTL
jgi:hypothetical protein